MLIASLWIWYEKTLWLYAIINTLFGHYFLEHHFFNVFKTFSSFSSTYILYRVLPRNYAHFCCQCKVKFINWHFFITITNSSIFKKLVQPFLFKSFIKNLCLKLKLELELDDLTNVKMLFVPPSYSPSI